VPACRVLLADDTPEIRLLLRMALELEGGFEIVGEAADGAQALHLADDHRPDAVILDLAMPVMDGLEAIPAIRRATPETKILVLSGFTSDQMEREALSVGADAYLEKGVPPQDIVALLQKLCSVSSNGIGTLPTATGTDSGASAVSTDPVAELTHELMTPVAVIQGFAEAISHKAKEISAQEIHDWAQKIISNAGSLVGIVRSFRGATELPVEDIELDISRFDVAAVTRRTLADLGTLATGRDVTFDLRDSVLVSADAVKVRQIVTNLVSNAVKFSDGPIEIRMEVGKFHVEIAVCDRGPGIPKHQRSELFKRFARFHPEVPGSGLGLYLSRQLARAQGGDIVFAARGGGGAAFKLRIPLAE
jgi:DNA-binding NarL/FixJ family response regulator/two-component sensor histidine kinase